MIERDMKKTAKIVTQCIVIKILLEGRHKEIKQEM